MEIITQLEKYFIGLCKYRYIDNINANERHIFIYYIY